MDMDITVSVGIGDLFVIYFTQPVIGGDGTGIGKDQTAYGIGNGRVFLYTPVDGIDIGIYQILVVQHGGSDVSGFFSLLSVKNISLGNIGEVGIGQCLLDRVLDLFDRDLAVYDFGIKVGAGPQCQHVDDAWMIVSAYGIKGLFDSCRDLVDVEIYYSSVSFNNLIHDLLLHASKGDVFYIWS